MFQESCMQEVPRLLQVFDASLKEVKGTFLTPAKMTLMHFFIINHFVRPKETCMQNFKFLDGREELRIELPLVQVND